MDISYSKGIILVSGPVNSGKSRFAEKILSSKKDVIYIATGIFNDQSTSWHQRIIKHKDRRPPHWNTIESANISNVLTKVNKKSTLLIDSLGGFVTANIDLNDMDWQKLLSSAVNNIRSFDGLIVLVAEEVGWGVSPSTQIGNRFRDRLGHSIEQIDSISNESWLVLHGRAINLSINSIQI